MNATLQCFSNCPRFKNYLLKLYKELESEKDSKYKISFALAEVLKNLWGILHHKYYAPENFKNIISELNPTFRGKAANDPKDLVLFIIQRIHTELNKEDPTIKTNNNDNSYDFWAEYISFMNFYKRNNNSIITEEFHFYTNDMTTCSFCNTTINNVQTNNILFFPLEEVRKFKGYFNNYVSIYDCFEYNERQTSSSFHCNACNNDSIAYSMTKIALSAKTLIINLNRGHGMEFNVNIVFEEYLNIRKYVYMNDSPYYYELTGVICHFGTNDDGGHFIAYCKNCDDCNWYKFNDGIITKCSFSEVCQKGMHYVLFYSYIQMED
jgi:ubiquitin C-terminal hydrolase